MEELGHQVLCTELDLHDQVVLATDAVTENGSLARVVYNVQQAVMFYNEYSAYRWTIDSLAKKRGIPTADLRGMDRADQGK